MPHTSTTDLMVDKCTREVRQMDAVCRLIRERGTVPGLSVHPSRLTDRMQTTAYHRACPWRSSGLLQGCGP